MPTSSKVETKQTYDRLKLKYGYLWNQLKEDPSVIQELESIKAAEAARHPLSNVTNHDASSLINAPILGPEPTDEPEKLKEEKPTESTPTPNSSTRADANDFLSAIMNKETINTRVQSEDCCNLEGCEGCADPVLEIDSSDEGTPMEQENEINECTKNNNVLESRFEAINDSSDDSSSQQSSSEESSLGDNQDCASSSSGGSTVIHFDLISHLQINSTDENSISMEDYDHNDTGNDADDEMKLSSTTFTNTGSVTRTHNADVDVEVLNLDFQKCNITIGTGMDSEGSSTPNRTSELHTHSINNEERNSLGENDQKDTAQKQTEWSASASDGSSSGSSSDSSANIEFKLTNSSFIRAGIEIDSDSEADIEFRLTDSSFIRAGIEIGRDSEADSAKMSSKNGLEESSSDDSSTNIEFEFDQSTFIDAGIDIDDANDNDQEGLKQSGQDEHDRSKDTDSGVVVDEMSGHHGTGFDIVIDGTDNTGGYSNVARDTSNTSRARSIIDSKITHEKNDKHDEREVANKNQPPDCSSDEAEWSENNAGPGNDDSTIGGDTVHENEVFIVDDSVEISYESPEDLELDLSDTIGKLDDTLPGVGSGGVLTDKNATPKKSEKESTDFSMSNTDVKESRVTFILDDSDDDSGIEQERRVIIQKTPKQKRALKKKPPNFKRNRDLLTKEAFQEFNEKVFKGALDTVEVKWSTRLISTAGLTRLKRRGKGPNQTRTAVIELSTKMIDQHERLRSTLMHEMCHAAAWLVDTVHKPPHGSCFKKWAALGMRKVR